MRGFHPVLPMYDRILLPGMLLRMPVILPEGVAAAEYHLATGRPLVAVPTLHPLPDGALPDSFVEVGCLAAVRRLVRLGDGSCRLLLEGLARVRIAPPRQDPDAGHVTQVRPMTDRVRDPDRVQTLHQRLADSMAEWIAEDPSNPASMRKLPANEQSPARLADHVAANLTLPRLEQIAFLSEGTLDARLQVAIEGIAREGELRKVKLEVDKKVQATLDKQQRDYYLREQIRGLRKELGEVPGSYDEAAALEQRLRDAGMPDQGLKDALRELERLRRMHPDAAEYTVARTWLEWLANMPWDTRSEDDMDLHRAKAALDAEHYGLEKIKDRILEYLAVRTLNPAGKGPVLCFVGPPGVGKTSLGQSVARALGRKFARVSLGGMKDEAEIRGHRRTYVGALPGRLVHALKKAGTKNPVIVLDEIDKLGKDFRGDPASALLEVLDPAQNHAFVDHYLDIPVDLSEVMFICTANRTDPIPEALLDRLEQLDIPGYLLEEKLRIAQQHLLPRLGTSHGLAERGFAITRQAIRAVVESYTREAGVRQLQQKLAALHRKAARKFVEGRSRGIRIDRPEQVEAFLGPARHFVEVVERTNLPGIVVGLAWTAAGGDILFIEATAWADEKGSLKLTGQLGTVMKESAEAALSVVRTRREALQIPDDSFSKRGIHVHIPAGAVPKDGPSAGITLVTAFASVLTGRLVQPALAMTGEVTLRGKVLPVGGIKEKVLAARRAGVKRIILPAKNRNDLVDIPVQLRRDLEFHYVEDIDEVLSLALAEALPQ
ncbi:MAG: endopeptidase La [Deltaproteobacteria bacterium]|nr:endopeptidase La [Deltaproteobacteria bacterium]